MSLFHKHKFDIIIKTYTPGRNLTGVNGISEYIAERLIFGLTTCILQCKECGKLTKEELLGNEIK